MKSQREASFSQTFINDSIKKCGRIKCQTPLRNERVRANKGSAGIDGMDFNKFEEKLNNNLYKILLDSELRETQTTNYFSVL